MNPQEIRDKIMAAINGIIKDEPETSETNLHDVLAAKMRARINGETEGEEGELEGEPPANPETPPITTAPAEIKPPATEPTGA